MNYADCISMDSCCRVQGVAYIERITRLRLSYRCSNKFQFGKFGDQGSTVNSFSYSPNHSVELQPQETSHSTMPRKNIHACTCQMYGCMWLVRIDTYLNRPILSSTIMSVLRECYEIILYTVTPSPPACSCPQTVDRFLFLAFLAG